MAEIKEVRPETQNPQVVDRAQGFWSRYNRPIIYAATALILLCGAYLAWKYLVKEPNEVKANEAIFKAEDYYRADSLQLALNGDGANPGFLKVIDNYGGTEAGNRARFYAGDIYLKLGDFKKAESHLEEFETDSRPVQARAYKLLADAYAEQGKNSEALSNYRKAANHFTQDENNASEYLFMAAYFADRVMNNKKEAIELYKELKQKYPRTQRGFEADKYLAQSGVYK